jgi:methyl-accepting chemotaxis protein
MLATQSVGVRQAIDGSLGSITSSLQAVGEVAEVLRSENGSVCEVGRGLDAIASATDEQKRVSHEVVASIEAISGMARDNSIEVAQTSSAAQTLDELARTLQSTVERFKV